MLLTNVFPSRKQIFHLAPDRTGAWTITLLKLLNHTDPSREDGGNVSAPITCILPMPHNVYTGDDDGRVVRSSVFFEYFDFVLSGCGKVSLCGGWVGSTGDWYRRKRGWEGQVEWRGERGTVAVEDLEEIE